MKINHLVLSIIVLAFTSAVGFAQDTDDLEVPKRPTNIGILNSYTQEWLRVLNYERAEALFPGTPYNSRAEYPGLYETADDRRAQFQKDYADLQGAIKEVEQNIFESEKTTQATEDLLTGSGFIFDAALNIFPLEKLPQDAQFKKRLLDLANDKAFKFLWGKAKIPERIKNFSADNARRFFNGSHTETLARLKERKNILEWLQRNQSVDYLSEKYKHADGLLADFSPELIELVKLNPRFFERMKGLQGEELKREQLSLVRELALEIVDTRQQVQKQGSAIKLLDSYNRLEEQYAKFEFKLTVAGNNLARLQQHYLSRLSSITADINLLKAEMKKKPSAHTAVALRVAEKTKAELQQKTLLSAGELVDDPRYVLAYREASGAEITREDIEQAAAKIEQIEMRQNLEQLNDALAAGRQFALLAHNLSLMDDDTYRVISGTIQAVEGLANAGASFATGNYIGVATGMMQSMNGIIAAAKKQKKDEALGKALTAILQNQKTIINQLTELRNTVLVLNYQLLEYLHTEFDIVHMHLETLVDDTRSQTERDLFGACSDFEVLEEKLTDANPKLSLHESIDFLTRQNAWQHYALCLGSIVDQLRIDRNRVRTKLEMHVFARLDNPQGQDERQRGLELVGRHQQFRNSLEIADYLFDASHAHAPKNGATAAFALLQSPSSSYAHLRRKYDSFAEAPKGSARVYEMTRNRYLDVSIIAQAAKNFEMIIPWSLGFDQNAGKPNFLTTEQIAAQLVELKKFPQQVGTLFPSYSSLSPLAQPLRDIVDAATVQQALLDGDILLPGVWEVLAKGLSGMAAAQDQRPDQLPERSDEYKKITQLISKNPILTQNVLRWGIYRSLEAVPVRQQVDFVRAYRANFYNHNSQGIMASLRELVEAQSSPSLRAPPPWTDYSGLMIYTESEYQILAAIQREGAIQAEFDAKLVKAPAHSDVHNAAKRDKEKSVERSDWLKKLLAMSLAGQKRDVAHDQQNPLRAESSQEMNKFFNPTDINTGMYLKFPGMQFLVKLPNPEALEKGQILSTQGRLTKLQERAKHILWSYKVPELLSKSAR